VTGNTIEDSYRGIYGSNTATSYTITGNRVVRPVSNGIYLEAASYTTIADNNVQVASTQGVIIVAGERNNVVNNLAYDGSSSCYDIRSTRSLLLGNEARNCEIGIDTGNSDNVLIDNQIINPAAQVPTKKKQKRN
jgi:parallel beta-helix repeat protein